MFIRPWNTIYHDSKGSKLQLMIQDISISALYLSSKLNETPVRLRDLINTYIFLNSRIKHLLSLPHDQSLTSDLESEGLWRIGGSTATNGKGKGKGKAWDGFIFEVPGFHDEVFWDWKDVITSSEMQILKRLGFQMQASHLDTLLFPFLCQTSVMLEPELIPS